MSVDIQCDECKDRMGEGDKIICEDCINECEEQIIELENEISILLKKIKILENQ